MPDRRLELAAVLRCPACGGTPYRLYRRQHVAPNGELLPTHEAVLWPTSPTIPPPTRPERILCPDCHIEVQRAAP